MMLLPGYSLKDYENERLKRNGDLSRAAKYVQEKQAEKDQGNAQSGH